MAPMFISSYEHSPTSLLGQSTSSPLFESQAKRDPQRRSHTRRSANHELERLRQDVQMLEEKLARVKKGASLYMAGEAGAPCEKQQRSSETKSIWMDLALHQYNLRQSSQSTNRRLKRLLTKQLKIAKCLEEMLARKSDEKTLHAIDMYDVPGYRPLQQRSGEDELVFGSLLIHLQQLYATKDSHVKQSGLEADLVAMHTERKHDPMHGTMLQTVSSMAVPFTVQKTDVVIWEGLMNGNKRISSVDYHGYHRTVTEDRIQKNYMSNFQDRQSTYGLHNRTIIRKYTEAKRVVYAWTTVTVLGSMRLRFFAQGMMIVEPSKTVPLSATVLKNWYRVHGERIDTSRPACEQIEGIIKGIENMLSGTMIAMFQWLEGNLLDVNMKDRKTASSKRV